MHQQLQDFYANDGGAANGMAEVTLTPYTEGIVFDQHGLLIDALPVRHSTETYALRFRAGGRSIVHSADTAYHEPLIEFARGADLLIHSAMAVTAMREHWGRRWDDIHAIMAPPAAAGQVGPPAQRPKPAPTPLPPR